MPQAPLLMQTGARELAQGQAVLAALAQQAGLTAETRGDLEALAHAAKRNQLTCALAARGSFAAKKMALDLTAHPLLPVVKFT